MSKWVNVFDIKDIWSQLSDDELDVSEGGKLIAAKIRTELIPKVQADESINDDILIYKIEDIAEEFEIIDEYNTNHFDWCMNELYDWADTSLDGKVGGKKMCWVATTF